LSKIRAFGPSFDLAQGMTVSLTLFQKRNISKYIPKMVFHDIFHFETQFSKKYAQFDENAATFDHQCLASQKPTGENI
jgi:hypothetical protein